MLKDIFILRDQDELHVYDFFTREFRDRICLGDHVQIECYDEMVFVSGELQKNSITEKLYLIDRNGFVCDIEYQMLYENIWIYKQDALQSKSA